MGTIPDVGNKLGRKDTTNVQKNKSSIEEVCNQQCKDHNDL
jgi:hypothetical protein